MGFPAILIVDDASSLRKLLARMLGREGYGQIEQAADADAAQAQIATRDFDLVITDLNMPGRNGLQLMEWARAHHSGPMWIILSGYGTFESAVDAIHLGAFAFVQKPIESSTAFCMTVRNALEQKRLMDEKRRLDKQLLEANRELQSRVEQLETACGLLGGQSEIIAEDLHRAERIQRALLPRAVPTVPGFSAAALYRPCQTIGGDFYDLVRLDDTHVAFVIADAAGHGVSAAMLSVLFKMRLQQLIREAPSIGPSRMLQRLNEFLFEECGSPGLFITAAYGVVDVEEGEIAFASAGHPPALLQRAKGGVELLRHTGPALGLTNEAKYAQACVRFSPGDRLLCYTDGLFDGWPASELPLGDRVAELFGTVELRGSDGIVSILAEASKLRRGLVPPDDVTLLLLGAEEFDPVLDNGESALAELHPIGELPVSEVAVLIGQEGGETFFSVEGRGTWAHSSTFFEAAKRELSKDASLTIDLSCCTYLDSTFLGTMHELVTYSDERGSAISLQGATPQVVDAFCELGMDRVLHHLSQEAHALATQMRPLGRNRDRGAVHTRLVCAHEALAALSEENRAAFAQLLEALHLEETPASNRC